MYKIHAFIGDNATSNDTQTAELQKKNNLFDTSNHVYCFNHIIQLSCKALLKLFTFCIPSSATDNNNMSDIEGTEDNENEPKDKNEKLACNMNNDIDDDIDELEALSTEEQTRFLEAMAAVKETVTKVRILSFTYMILPFMMLSGSKIVFFDHPLYSNCIAHMASCLQGQPPQAQFDPTRGCYTMEFYL